MSSLTLVARCWAVLSVLAITNCAMSQQPTIADSSAIPALESRPPCVTSGSAGYGKQGCVIIINRSDIKSRTAFILPKGVNVAVEITNARPNEKLSVVITNAKTPPLDPFGGAIKTITAPLGSLVITTRADVRALDGGAQQPDDIDNAQKAVSDSLSSVQTQINNANSAAACLAAYQSLQDDFTCSQKEMLTRPNFDDAQDAAHNLAQAASQRNLPLQAFADLEANVPKAYTDCTTSVNGMPIRTDAERSAKAQAKKTCDFDSDRHSSNEARIKSAINSIESAQVALASTASVIDAMVIQDVKQAFTFVTEKFVNSTATVTGQEEVLKGSTTVIAILANAQATSWVISSGVGFSTLKSFTYSNAPIVVNGQPVLDSGGKVTTIVTRTETSPSIITPSALISYRINPISHARWEQSDWCGCAFLMTGGIGANLTTKSADFDAGFSFQRYSVVLTPSVHFGRESRLSNGVAIGQQLGSSPPSLTTNSVWVRKFGFSITYVIPTPTAGS